MNNLTAAKLIERQRQRWHSDDSDEIIALRTERVFRAVAICELGMGAALTPIALRQTLLPPPIFSAVFIACAAMLFWQNWRYTQVRKFIHYSKFAIQPNPAK
jgi:hypothetical protein